MSEQCGARIKLNFHKRYHRNMGACNDQYYSGGYNNLYLFPCCRAVRYFYYKKYRGNNKHYPNFCGDRAALPEQCCAGITCQFN